MRTVLWTMALALVHAAGAAGVAVAAEPPAAAKPAYDSAFADYQPYREPVVKLAGRDKAVVPTTKPPAKPADPHAGHAMHHPTPAPRTEAHAGHGQHQPQAKPTQPEAHEHHEHQQQ